MARLRISPGRALPTRWRASSGVMMLNHLHEEAIAVKIRKTYDLILSERNPAVLTRDLGGTASADGC